MLSPPPPSRPRGKENEARIDIKKRYLHTDWRVVCTTSKIDKELNKEEEAAKARGASKHTPTNYQAVSNTPPRLGHPHPPS
jgi:hypothetical protein